MVETWQIIAPSVQHFGPRMRVTLRMARGVPSHVRSWPTIVGKSGGNGKASHTRCAIYTRKSTEEGLEQEFNTLDAQREAGEAILDSRNSGPCGIRDPCS